MAANTQRVQLLLNSYQEFPNIPGRKHIKTEYLEDGTILVTLDITQVDSSIQYLIPKDAIFLL